MSADFSERLDAIEAREAIRDLVVRYGMAVDDREMEQIAALFTKDAVFRHGDGAIVNNGRKEIVDFYTDRLASFGATYHYADTHLIELDGADDAHGIVCAHAELAIEDATYITALRYHDKYQREDGVWKFAERSIAMLYFMDMADLAAGGLSMRDRKRYFGTVGSGEIPEGLPSWQRFFAEARS